jgi:hypothetical protein
MTTTPPYVTEEFRAGLHVVPDDYEFDTDDGLGCARAVIVAVPACLLLFAGIGLMFWLVGLL